MPGGDGLEELVAELYPYVFIDRLNKLVDHLKRKSTIDGLVVLNVRHLLHERQKKHDPLGYRVFEVFHQAVAQAVAEEDLFVLEGDARIRNNTVLGCRPDLAPDRLYPAPEETVGEWNDALMPELVKGKGKARERVVADLRTFLGRLPDEGIEGFVFRELLEPLKNDARVRWAIRFAPLQGETGVAGDTGEDESADVVRVVPPDPEVEDRESLEKLDRCLAASFDRLAPDRARDDLKILWRDLHDHAQDGEIPSRRKLADELDLPRRRLTMLFTILGELVEDCRRAQLAATFTETAATAGGDAMSSKSRAEALREQTGRARRRHAVVEEERDRRSRREPRPGDIFAGAAAGDHPVEWVLLQESAGGFYAVPADISPLAGPSDVVVPVEAACGPLTLRCAFGLRLDPADLDPETWNGSLPSESLRQALASVGAPAGPVEDPELDAWIQEVVEPAREAVRFGQGARSRTLEPDPCLPWHRHRMGGNPYALAASILLLISLGLSAGMLWQRQEILRLATGGDLEAVGNIPFQSLLFSADSERNRLDELTLPADAREIVLLLNVTALDRPFERYRLRLSNKATGDEIWRGEELVRVKGDTLTVKLPVRLIPEGEYLFELSGVDGSQVEALAEHALHIEVAR